MESPTVGDQNLPRALGKPKRPIRTYSKRTSSDVAEPSTKRRRIESSSPAAASKDDTTEPVHNPSTRQPSPSLPPLQPARKGTITSYFKVLPLVSSSTMHSSEPPSESAEPVGTPPSSPPIPDIQRKKRRRLQVTTHVLSRATSEEGSGTEDIVEKDRDEESEESGAILKALTPTKQQPNILSDANADTLNQVPSRRKKRSDGGKRGRASKSAAVQTTLSLSAEEKGFTECKECNMLYNPLHKQDAKCHAKRHAAMLKAKSGSPDKEIQH